jgi:aminoglycoside 6'-N-acetyltransferase
VRWHPAGHTDRVQPNASLDGERVRLRPVREDDVVELARIRRTPEVHRHWRGGDDLAAAVQEDLAEPDSVPYTIEVDDRVVGWTQWQAEDEPDYRHASIDVYVDPAVHGRGIRRHLARQPAHGPAGRRARSAS